MDWDDIKAQWPSQRTVVARRWQRLSERELDEIGGDRQRLCERLQDVYCIDRKDAQRQVAEWEAGQAAWDPSSADGPAPVTAAQVARGRTGKPSAPDIEHLVSTGTFPAQPESPREETDAQSRPCDEHGYMDDEAQRDRSEPGDSGAGA
jgi:hypothetical protein